MKEVGRVHSLGDFRSLSPSTEPLAGPVRKYLSTDAEHAQQFYDDFLHSLILPFSQRFDDPAWRDTLAVSLESFFTRRDIDFVAVDGTCSKDLFQDFVVFFGGAYGVKGQISLEGESKRVRAARDGLWMRM